VLVLESEDGMVVRSKSEATVFCLTRDKYSQNYTFTWLRQFEGNNNSPEVCSYYNVAKFIQYIYLRIYIS
jgi:hypothetical protein